MTLAVQQVSGRPRSRTYRMVHRVADRMAPLIADAFVADMIRIQGSVDVDKIRRQLDRGASISEITTSIPLGPLGIAVHQEGATFAESFEREMARSATAAGHGALEIVDEATGTSITFNAANPDVVIFARNRSSRLVVAVTDDVRNSIRAVIASAAEQGLTTQQQARIIRETVGLPPNWANATATLGDDIRNGRTAAATGRRLSAVDKAQIRARIAAGTVDEAFIADMERKYGQSLLNRRAQNIARTESIRAANEGTRIGWRQAIDEGALPQTSRRMWIVTPDDRLRPTHAAIPGMNPDGVAMDRLFATPEGFIEGPPLGVNCRCGEGMTFPGLRGAL